jgi:hypothetical protein
MVLMAKKKPARARDRGEVRFVGAEISPALDDALEAQAAEEQRTKKVIIERALQAYLKASGRWPPKEESGS